MSELEKIADQLQSAYAGGAWHGPSVLEALQGVTPEIALRRPIPVAHNIWELTHHIGAWADIPRRRLAGEVFEITPAVNFPPVVETSEAGWRSSLNQLAESQKKLVNAILAFDEKRLDERTVKDGPTIYTVLHGVVQHHVYHAGQIMLLKK
jgi:uncharacterized damage-inducible protein DinB